MMKKGAPGGPPRLPLLLGLSSKKHAPRSISKITNVVGMPASVARERFGLPKEILRKTA